ncbi:Iron deficiency-induced protein A [Alcanivorax sp. ALC70]|nr:Iron deficiency-induced protein A [Alcanivorax sp. ALC70]
MRRFGLLASALSAALVLAGCGSPKEEVNVYSARKEALIKPLLDRYTEQTGVTVNLITGSADALVERMKAEGEHSPADLLVTVDAGRLYRAQQEDLLAPPAATNWTARCRPPCASRRATGSACPCAAG